MGYAVADWIEEYCVIPDGMRAGEPFVLTDEQLRFMVRHYRIKSPDQVVDVRRPSAPFTYRRSMLVRPQKWGKGPLTAAMICAEAVGPALFDGWDADGQPVGRPWPTPWIQIAAASSDQTINVYSSLLPMIQEGPLGDEITDTGVTRINLPGRGLIEPVTAEGRSRLGQRITFAVHDEPHSWFHGNGGWALADTQRRNLSGMGGRSVSTTNAWNPSEQSDAQRTFEADLADVWVDFPTPPKGNFEKAQDRHKILEAVYGDSLVSAGGWVDLERIEADVQEFIAKGDLPQAERFFGNRVVATSDAFFDMANWTALIEEDREVPPGAQVCLGFDGSMRDDWTAIRGRAFSPTGEMFGFTPTFSDGAKTIWNPADFGGEVPRGEVQAAIAELFERYEVIRMYLDPELWQSEIEMWASRYGDKRVITWPTYRTRQMSAALERLQTDLATSAFTHDGCRITSTHVGNARKVRRSGGIIVGKPNPQRKIDAAVADTLAHEAACDARAAGLTRKRTRRMVVYR